MDTNHRIPFKTWQKIKIRVCAGEDHRTVAKDFKVEPWQIANKSNHEKWPTKGRLRRSGSASGELSDREKGASSTPSEQVTQEKNVPQGEKSLTPSISWDSLLNAPPELFQVELGKFMQGLIAEGLPSIAPPRNISELKTYVEIWRKCSGLDVKAGGDGKTPLVNPMRTVSRRSAKVVDVEDFPI